MGRETPNRADERRRQTAEANVTAILDAALGLLEREPSPSFVEIARAAGVSRPTLYAHFPTRPDLVQAAVSRAVAQTARHIAAARPDEGPATEALERLVRTAWRHLSRQPTVIRLAMEMPPEQRRQAHQLALAPVRRLVLRGQASGEFRDDQPAEWLVSVLYALLHAAAEDVNAGRLDEHAVPALVHSSTLAAFRPTRALVRCRANAEPPSPPAPPPSPGAHSCSAER